MPPLCRHPQFDFQSLTVEGGVEELVPLRYSGEFRYLDTSGSDLSAVEKVLDPAWFHE